MTEVASPLRAGRRAWTAWIIAVLFVVLVFGFQTAYAITNPLLAEDRSLTPTQVGLVASVYTWCFALTQLMSGSLLDRVGARRCLPLACVFIVAGMLVFAGANGFTMLLISQVLVAIGASFGFIGAGFVGGVWFGMALFGTMFAWVQFIASTSAAVNQNVFTAVLGVLDWQSTIRVMAGSGVLLLVLMVLLLRDPPGWDDTHGWPSRPGQFVRNVMHDVAGVATRPRMWAILLMGAASFGGLLTFGIVWGPELGQGRGLTQDEARMATSLIWLGLAVGAPAWARLSNVLGRRRLPLIVGVLGQSAAILAAALLPDPGRWGLSLLYLALGLFGGSSMLAFTMGAELAGLARAGTASSLVNGSQFVLGGLLMAVPGRLLSTGQEITTASAAVAGIMIVLCLLALPLPETAGREDTEATAAPTTDPGEGSGDDSVTNVIAGDPPR